MTVEKAKKAPAKKAAAPKKATSAKSAAPKAAASGTITVKQVRSGAGRGEKQNATLKGLGLCRINRTRTLEDTPAVRGMIAKVAHLVEVIDAA